MHLSGCPHWPQVTLNDGRVFLGEFQALDKQVSCFLVPTCSAACLDLHAVYSRCPFITCPLLLALPAAYSLCLLCMCSLTAFFCSSSRLCICLHRVTLSLGEQWKSCQKQQRSVKWAWFFCQKRGAGAWRCVGQYFPTWPKISKSTKLRCMARQKRARN